MVMVTIYVNVFSELEMLHQDIWVTGLFFSFLFFSFFLSFFLSFFFLFFFERIYKKYVGDFSEKICNYDIIECLKAIFF